MVYLITTMMKHFIAIRTLIAQWFVRWHWLAVHLSQAVSLMVQHFMFSTKPFATERTEETTSAGMQFHVNVVISLTSEAFRANWALEWFLTNA